MANKKKAPQYRGIDLFCGIGGFRLAMENSNVDCVFSSDIDKFAQETYNANFHEIPVGDITKVEAKDIPAFDILTAGFPCQPFSYAGEKKGFEDTTRGTLFFDICRILEYHKPPMVFLENVKGLVSHKEGETLKIILDNLRKLGYYPHWAILSSLDFGLPQKRERWYCVAFRENFPFEFPKPLGGHPTLRDIVDLDDHSPQLTPKEDSEWTRLWTEEQRKNWIHKIGNLVPLARRKNSEAQNYEFEEKKAKYFTGRNGTSAYALTTQVLQYKEWTPDVVEKRQEFLLGVFRKNWDL